MVDKDKTKDPVTKKLVGLRQRFSELGNPQSDSNQVAEEAHESEMKYRAVFEQAFQMTGILAPDGSIVDLNQITLEFIGAKLSEIAGKPFWETPWWVHSPQEQELARAAVKDAANGQFARYETAIVGTDGSLRHMDFSLKPVRNDIGSIVNLIAEARDITDRKRTEDALRENEGKFRAIFEQAFQMTGILTLNGTIIDVNQVALDFIGVKLTDVLGKMFWKGPWWAHSLREQVRVRAAVKNAASGKFVRFESTIAGSDEGVRHIDFSLKPGRDHSGKIVFLIPEARDITNRKKIEDGLRESEQRYRSISKELEAFVYSVSHDLRAPLRAINGFSEALLEDYTDKLDEEGKTYLRYLQDGSRDMGELIDGLLTLSRSTRGELSRERIDLSVLVDTVIAELRQAEPQQQVTVNMAADIRVDADPCLFKVVLENLLGNAWKYSSQTADARIEVGVEEQDGETVYLVKDNGAGFDMAFADKLFQPFHRLHRTDEFSGTGIGLATVERIIHRHGGKIWAEAAVGKGASFYFTLKNEGSNHG